MPWHSLPPPRLHAAPTPEQPIEANIPTWPLLALPPVAADRRPVSRDWSGKTLAEHKADRAEVVHAALAEAGIDAPEVDRCSATQTGDDGTPRYQWAAPSREVDQEHRRLVIRQAINERLRWRTEYAEAKARAGPHDNRSATEPDFATSAA